MVGERIKKRLDLGLGSFKQFFTDLTDRGILNAATALPQRFGPNNREAFR